MFFFTPNTGEPPENIQDLQIYLRLLIFSYLDPSSVSSASCVCSSWRKELSLMKRAHSVLECSVTKTLKTPAAQQAGFLVNCPFQKGEGQAHNMTIIARPPNLLFLAITQGRSVGFEVGGLLSDIIMLPYSHLCVLAALGLNYRSRHCVYNAPALLQYVDDHFLPKAPPSSPEWCVADLSCVTAAFIEELSTQLHDTGGFMTKIIPILKPHYRRGIPPYHEPNPLASFNYVALCGEMVRDAPNDDTKVSALDYVHFDVHNTPILEMFSRPDLSEKMKRYIYPGLWLPECRFAARVLPSLFRVKH